MLHNNSSIPLLILENKYTIQYNDTLLLQRYNGLNLEDSMIWYDMIWYNMIWLIKVWWVFSTGKWNEILTSVMKSDFSDLNRKFTNQQRIKKGFATVKTIRSSWCWKYAPKPQLLKDVAWDSLDIPQRYTFWTVQVKRTKIRRRISFDGAWCLTDGCYVPRYF